MVKYEYQCNIPTISRNLKLCFFRKFAAASNFKTKKPTKPMVKRTLIKSLKNKLTRIKLGLSCLCLSFYKENVDEKF